MYRSLGAKHFFARIEQCVPFIEEPLFLGAYHPTGNGLIEFSFVRNFIVLLNDYLEVFLAQQ